MLKSFQARAVLSLLISATAAHAGTGVPVAESIHVVSGYTDGVFDVSIDAGTGSAIMAEAVKYYRDAGAVAKPQGIGGVYYTLAKTEAEEALMDNGKDGKQYDPPRYTWNFQIPFAELKRNDFSATGGMLQFGGTTARTLLAGMKKSLTSTQTPLDENMKPDGGYYGGKRIACEERISKNFVSCSIRVLAPASVPAKPKTK